MTNQARNRIKWIGVIIGFGLILYFAYNLKFKFVINDYRSRQIQKNLTVNFERNKIHFDELLVFCKTFGTLDNVSFGKKEQVSFQLYDSIDARSKIENRNFLNIGEYSRDSIQDITFSDSNTLLVSYPDTSILLHNWVIDFDGNVHNPLVGKLLAYHNTTIEQLRQLKPLLHKINCSHFDKDENLIRVRYAGHWGESFDYIITITNTVNKGSLNNLSDSYYWEHRLSELFCGLTDW